MAQHNFSLPDLYNTFLCIQQLRLFRKVDIPRFLFFYLQGKSYLNLYFKILLEFFIWNLGLFHFLPTSINFSMKMKFCRLLVIVKSEKKQGTIYPGEYSVNENSEHIKKRTVLHRKENWDKNSVVANFEGKKSHLFFISYYKIYYF